MYSNEYLGINTNQDILKDTAELFPETYQTVNGYDNAGVTFQNFTPSTNALQGVNNNIAQPQTIITYQDTNLQPIKQDIHESLEPSVDPYVFTSEANFETTTQEINLPQTTVQTNYEYIQPETNYQNLNLPPQNLNQIITYKENPVNEYLQYDTALQTEPINDPITINKTTQAPIIETKVLPSKIIQSPPIESTTYQYSEPVVENGLTLQNIEQTQNFDLGGQYSGFIEETKQVPEPSSYSLVPQPVIVPPPKPKETVIVKVPKIQKVIVPKIQKVIVPSNKKIIVRRPPGIGVSTIKRIPQPVPAALQVPATISTSSVRVPYSTASIQTPLVQQVQMPITPSPTPVSVPATIPYSAASVGVPYSVSSVKVPVTTPMPIPSPQTVGVQITPTPVSVPAVIPYSAASVKVPYSVSSVKIPSTASMLVPSPQTVGVPIAPSPVPVPATIPYSATSIRVPYSIASVKVPVKAPITTVPTPVPAVVGVAPTMASTIRPTLPVPARPPVVPVARALPVATAVPVGPAIAQTVPYSTLYQRPLVANAAQPLPVSAVPPRPVVVPQATNLGMARPAIYSASTYNSSTIRPVGRTLPVYTGVAPAKNNMIGNMAFQGRYNTRTYNARKL